MSAHEYQLAITDKQKGDDKDKKADEAEKDKLKSVK